MTENVVFTKTFSALAQVDEKEVWRYAGYAGLPGKDAEALRGLLDSATAQALPLLSYRVCYRRFALAWKNGLPVLPFETDSKGLAKCLDGSAEAVMFAATIGFEIDRLIEKTLRVSPAEALLIQALGAERVEALCDEFCAQFARESGFGITPRFSPGYGDFPLETQRDFFRLLDCSRKIGLSLNDSLLMSPSKSVTAVFGLRANRDGSRAKNRCAKCGLSDCAFRAND